MSDSSLPRNFGVWTGLLVTVASMVGVGILTTSGYTIQATESPQTLLVLWIVGGVLSLCGALTYAELATMLPRAGGDYVFVREAYGDGIGFAYGWATFLFGFAGPTALISHACVVYLLMPWQRSAVDAGGEWPPWITPLGASVLIIVFTIMHCRGQRSSAHVQNATTLFKFLLLILFVLAGLAGGGWTVLSEGRVLAEQEFGVAMVSLVYVFYAYLGWNASVYLAGEMREPEKSLPRAIVGGTLLVTLLYLAMNLTYLIGIGPEGLRDASPTEVEAIAETAGRRLFGRQIANILSVLFGAGILASVSAYILTGSRISFAMAVDGLFPSYTARWSPQHESPVNAVITLGLCSIVLLWASQLVAGAADAFRSLLNYTTVGLVLLTSLAVTSLFVLRRRKRDRAAFRVPLYPLPPILFLIVTAMLMFHAVRLNPGPTLLGTATVLSGWPLYRLSQRKRH
jgi:basic amino acid/polyamine antiporter, APA family